MKKITKEVFRTPLEKEAIDYCSKHSNSRYTCLQTDSYARTSLVNPNLRLLQYLKTGSRELLNILQKEFNTTEESKEYYRRLLDPLLSKLEGGRLSPFQKPLLVERGYLQGVTSTSYLVIRQQENPLDYGSIKVPVETYTEYLSSIKSLLEGTGYREISLPLSVSYKENFSFLNLRGKKVVSESDNYYLGPLKSPKTRLLKPHCTGIMLNKIKNQYSEAGEAFYYSISRVYRKETEDKSHSCSFTQLEVTHTTREKNVSKILEKFLSKIKEVLRITNPLQQIELYYTYYPYTTPSVEFYNKDLSLELGGGGLFNFKLLKSHNAFGFAIGLDRCYMYKNNLNKIGSIV